MGHAADIVQENIRAVIHHHAPGRDQPAHGHAVYAPMSVAGRLSLQGDGSGSGASLSERPYTG